MGKMRLKFQKWDIAVVAGVLALAILVFCLFLPKQTQPSYAEIYRDGQLVQRVSLAEDQEITVTGAYTNTITVKDGKIAITGSDCPGLDCVHCGWISDQSRSIVCLPNGVEIRLISPSSDVDIVVG